jgi:hypothetical protein
MNCNLTACMYNMNNACVSGQPDESKLLPHSVSCSEFESFAPSGEELRTYLIELIEEIGLDNQEAVISQMRITPEVELLLHVDAIESLYSLHRRNKALDRILAEVKELGADGFRQKYAEVLNT